MTIPRHRSMSTVISLTNPLEGLIGYPQTRSSFMPMETDPVSRMLAGNLRDLARKFICVSGFRGVLWSPAVSPSIEPAWC
jgi:hypothetical protein